jgi:hypothetical protein
MECLASTCHFRAGTARVTRSMARIGFLIQGGPLEPVRNAACQADVFKETVERDTTSRRRRTSQAGMVPSPTSAAASRGQLIITMATRDPAATEHRARRRFGRAILGFAMLAAVSGLGTLVTYVQAWDLLNGDTRSVVGTVVDERKGFLGIRNLVTVEYELGSEWYQAEIPVKGDGFRGRRISAYF